MAVLQVDEAVQHCAQGPDDVDVLLGLDVQPRECGGDDANGRGGDRCALGILPGLRSREQGGVLTGMLSSEVTVCMRDAAQGFNRVIVTVGG